MAVTAIPMPEILAPKKLILLPINDETVSPLTLLAGVSGQSIYIWGLFLFVNAATDLKLLSNTTPIMGTMGFAGQGNIVLPKLYAGDPTRQRGHCYAFTAAGQGLNISNSGNVRLSGGIYVSQQ